MNVLITGASGFVGRTLFANLSAQKKFKVSGSVRASSRISVGDAHVVIGDIDGDTSWQAALQGIDVVVHTAARHLDDRLGNTATQRLGINEVGCAQRLGDLPFIGIDIDRDNACSPGHRSKRSDEYQTYGRKGA